MIAYKVSHIETGKSYIGITKNNLKVRWGAHVSSGRKITVRSTLISRAIAKHGKEAFKVEHIASATTLEDLCALECLLIAQEGTMVPHGYNLVAGGKGGFNPSSETLAKMSAVRTGRRPSPETRARMGEAQRGRTIPAEVREKMRVAATGRQHTEETKLKISSAHAGTKRGPHPIETREKIRASNTGKKHSLEAREKMSKAHAGKPRKPLSPETRAKIAAAHLGKPKPRRADRAVL